MYNYIRKMRSKIGHDKFIHPAARIIIENEKQEFLLIERSDNGQLGIPAGALEEGETIEACIRREVQEETGLRLLDLHVIGISSDPQTESVEYSNGDQIQYFTVEFYSNKWEGKITVKDIKEVKTAQFRSKDIIQKLPKNELSAFESLKYYKEHGRIRLK